MEDYKEFDVKKMSKEERLDYEVDGLEGCLIRIQEHIDTLKKLVDTCRNKEKFCYMQRLTWYCVDSYDWALEMKNICKTICRESEEFDTDVHENFTEEEKKEYNDGGYDWYQ